MPEYADFEDNYTFVLVVFVRLFVLFIVHETDMHALSAYSLQRVPIVLEDGPISFIREVLISILAY